MSNNPPANTLPSGLSSEQVEEAVRKSGYPLQMVISDMLRKKHAVEEEWSYFDSEGEQHRTIDILASRLLYQWDQNKNGRIRPQLDLLIECKQSELPYVFFMSNSKPWVKDFPSIAGLHKTEITVNTNNSLATWTYSVPAALGMNEEEFAKFEGNISMSFSKCVRKGKEIELSGADPFNSIVLPLTKAMDHFVRHEAPASTHLYHDLHLVLGIAVVDGPMIAVKLNDGKQTLEMAPWVRVVRHQTVEGASSFDRTKTIGIDIVHKEFFSDFIEKHAWPYAEKFGKLAIKHQVELATGKGFVKDLDGRADPNIEPLLRSKQ